MKIRRSLNESAISVFKKYNILTEDVFDDEEADDKVQLTAYYYDQDNKRFDLSTMKYVNSMRKFINKLMADTSKLDALGATALFVDDSKDRDVFSAIKEDDGTWTVDYDNFEELNNSIFLPTEYRDCTLNRILYSLFEDKPINFKYKSPTLANNIYKVPVDYRLGEDTYDLHWEDNGDATIKIRILKDQPQKIIDKKKEFLAKVCDYYGVELKQLSDRNYHILIPDQEKYFEEF